MKRINVDGYFRLRIISVLIVFIPSLTEFLRNRELFWHSAGYFLLQGALLLIMTPLSHEDKRLSWNASAIAASVCLLCLLFPESELKPAFPLVSVLLTVLIFIARGSMKNALNLKFIFNARAPWQGLEEYARLFSICILGTLTSVFTLMAAFPGKTDFILCATGFCAYVISYRYAYEGRSIFITGKKEKEIRETIRSNITVAGSGDDCSDSRISSLYKRMLKYFETERPYLNDKFNEEQLALALGTNISYISKCINLVSGSNFKNLVNSYRVDYAVALIRKDTHLRVIEVAMMSGFSSTSSFNVSFKQIMKMTPSEYIRAVQSENL